MSGKRTGIILMNLGSPDSTHVKDVKRYLNQFLMDKRVIDYPFLFRKLLVEGIIVPARAAKSAEAYRIIWTEEGSPLIVWTRKLNAALESQLTLPIEIAMRYGKPEMKAAYDALLRKSPELEEVIAIPMYPHYAMSSYETAVEHARSVHRANAYIFELKFVRPFYNNEQYIHALSGRMKEFVRENYDHLLFSFHGIPERHLTKTDPTAGHCLQSPDCCSTSSVAHERCYRHQCLKTMELVAAALDLPKSKYSYSFQSRLGREQWLRPYTDHRLVEMPGEGIKKLLVICPAFVSDCLETLEEIEIRGKESFIKAGGESFRMIPCLNDSKLWVQAISSWIEDILKGKEEMIFS
ncbi:MAG: ferrochelatase [Chitinophagales bacterium]